MAVDQYSGKVDYCPKLYWNKGESGYDFLKLETLAADPDYVGRKLDGNKSGGLMDGIGPFCI